MADENAVTKKIGELWQWVSSSVAAKMAAPESEYVPPGSAELARIADDIAKIDSRIMYLRTSIDAETAKIGVETARYRGKPSSRWPSVVRISVRSMMHTLTQMETALEQAYGMKTKLTQHMHALENASTQRTFVETLRATQSAPHGHLTDYDVRSAEDVMDEQRELQYRAAEFNGIVGARGGDHLDEDDLDAALADMFDDDAPAQTQMLVLPDVVRDTPTSSRTAARAQESASFDEMADCF